MFDVGFQEIVLISVIALLVIGPERLPSVARSVGLWVGKVQRFVAGVKSDINRELQNDELRGLLNSQEDQIRELKESLTETRNEFARTASVASSSLSEGMSSAVEQVRGAAEAVKEGSQKEGSQKESLEKSSAEIDSPEQPGKQPSDSAKIAESPAQDGATDPATASNPAPASPKSGVAADNSTKPDPSV